MRSRLSSCAPLAAALLLTAAVAEAQSFTPAADNTLFEEFDKGFPVGCPSATARSNGSGPSVFAGLTQGSGDRRAVLRFDLSSVAPGTTITSATLTLSLEQVAPSAPGAQPFAIHRLLADWGEGNSNSGGPIGGNGEPAQAGVDATWCDAFHQASPWANEGGDFAAGASATTSVGTTNGLPYTWGSTPEMVADVQMWVNNPASNFGWIVLDPEQIPDGEPAVSARRFASREHGSANLRPVLTIAGTPPPTAVPTVNEWGLMLLAALLAVGGWWALRRTPLTAAK